MTWMPSKLISALVLAIVSFILQTESYAANLEPESQVEIRIGLMKSGYDKLGRAFSFKDESARDDLYFDFFDPQESASFVLNEREPPEKLRITNREGKMKWQYSKKLSSIEVKSKNLQAQLSQTVSVQIKGKDYPDLAKIFVLGADTFADLLSAAEDDAELSSRLVALSDNIRGRTLLMQSFAAVPRGLIVPASYSKKSRKEKDLLIDETKLHVQLGASSKIDASGQEQTVYEIEAEKDGQQSTEDSDLAERFLDRLAAAGLLAEDLDDSSIDTLAFALKKYQKMGL